MGDDAPLEKFLEEFAKEHKVSPLLKSNLKPQAIHLKP
jgi:hypothetical protein